MKRQRQPLCYQPGERRCPAPGSRRCERGSARRRQCGGTIRPPRMPFTPPFEPLATFAATHDGLSKPKCGESTPGRMARDSASTALLSPGSAAHTSGQRKATKVSEYGKTGRLLRRATRARGSSSRGAEIPSPVPPPHPDLPIAPKAGSASWLLLPQGRASKIISRNEDIYTGGIQKHLPSCLLDVPFLRKSTLKKTPNKQKKEIQTQKQKPPNKSNQER